MFKRILVALDDSELSADVFAEAVALSKAVGARLLLLHVVSPSDAAYPAPILMEPSSVYPELHTEAIKLYADQLEKIEQKELELLKSRQAEATEAGILTEFSQHLGDPGRVICTLARTWEADLILMGRHGRSGVSELILGSVSNYVVHHAPCSVLTVQHDAASRSGDRQSKHPV